MITLIRYANEGFSDHLQEHILTSRRDPLYGCFAFIEEDAVEGLLYRSSYRNDHPHVENRFGQQKHVISLPGTTKVFVKNQRIIKNEEIYVSPDHSQVIIPIEPIEKEKVVFGDVRFPLSLDTFVEVELGFAKQQKELLNSLYEKIRGQYGDDISINTKWLDFSECIIESRQISL